ncbi:unnamed protein product [Mycena citricolor]|uniref:Peptide hydrolase n=1 Tax=Mycena citricolor TaxID=2018698 RepID=A0AAD2HHS0_9AGAR|nr:unnamed protein product [Mycena citricolor]
MLQSVWAILSQIVGLATIGGLSGQLPVENGLSSELLQKEAPLAFSDELRLVQLSPGSKPQWMTDKQKFEAKAQGIDFVDITDAPHLGSLYKKPRFTYPPPDSSSSIVRGVFPHLTTDEPRANLEHLTSYFTRYYNSDTGKESSEWLYSKILAYTDELASEEQASMINVNLVDHAFKQHSIIVRFAPSSSAPSDPITVMGAHLDSINRTDPYGRAPGAGDDGSGTVTLLETYRGLLAAGYVPVSPLEFHFYAGEEGGLLGSSAIVNDYEKAHKVVRGMLQFDMTAFHKAGTREELAIVTNTNQVDSVLTKHLFSLAKEYLDLPIVETQYPVGPTGAGPTSDHLIWHKAGYQACHPLEAQFKYANSHVHSIDDRMDFSSEFSFDHMLHFMKLGAAFAVEMSNY